MKIFLHKIYQSTTNKWAIIIILIVGVMASRSLFKHNYYFNMHDDLQMMRQLQLEKCFLDGQIPCRWVPDMGYGFGLPLFNYYPQLPYLVGSVFRLVDLPFNDVAKLTFALSLIFSGFAMYLFSREFFGRSGGLLSAVFYVWAPYRAVDVYVRGAMNESWAFVWFPLILLFSYKLISSKVSRGNKIVGSEFRHLIFLALSTAGLLLTHNLMVLVFSPVVAVWVVFWLIRKKSFSKFKNLFFAGLLSLGLTAFFTLPAIFEQKYVHIDSLVADYFQYFAHFASFGQLFISRFWGDGPSFFGPNDEMAFPVGHIHWVLVLIAASLLIFSLIRFKKIRDLDFVAGFGIIIGTAAAFMAHERSTFIWKMLPAIEFVQFPWRFLTLNVFAYSFAVGSLFYLLGKFKYFKSRFGRVFIFTVLSAIVIAFNWNYFSPVHSGPVTDEQKFSGESWRIQTQAGILDYLPIQAKDDPEFAAESLVEIIDGEARISEDNKGTDWAEFQIDVSSETSTVRVNIFNYPEWRARVNGEEVDIFVDKNEEFGRMYLTLPKGQSSVYLKLYNTPLRSISNVISLFAWLGVAGFVIWKKRTNSF